MPAGKKPSVKEYMDAYYEAAQNPGAEYETYRYNVRNLMQANPGGLTDQQFVDQLQKLGALPSGIEFSDRPAGVSPTPEVKVGGKPKSEIPTGKEATIGEAIQRGVLRGGAAMERFAGNVAGLSRAATELAGSPLAPVASGLSYVEQRARTGAERKERLAETIPTPRSFLPALAEAVPEGFGRLVPYTIGRTPAGMAVTGAIEAAHQGPAAMVTNAATMGALGKALPIVERAGAKFLSPRIPEIIARPLTTAGVASGLAATAGAPLPQALAQGVFWGGASATGGRRASEPTATTLKPEPQERPRVDITSEVIQPEPVVPRALLQGPQLALPAPREFAVQPLPNEIVQGVQRGAGNFSSKVAELSTVPLRELMRMSDGAHDRLDLLRRRYASETAPFPEKGSAPMRKEMLKRINETQDEVNAIDTLMEARKVQEGMAYPPSTEPKPSIPMPPAGAVAAEPPATVESVSASSVAPATPPTAIAPPTMLPTIRLGETPMPVAAAALSPGAIPTIALPGTQVAEQPSVTIPKRRPGGQPKKKEVVEAPPPLRVPEASSEKAVAAMDQAALDQAWNTGKIGDVLRALNIKTQERSRAPLMQIIRDKQTEIKFAPQLATARENNQVRKASDVVQGQRVYIGAGESYGTVESVKKNKIEIRDDNGTKWAGDPQKIGVSRVSDRELREAIVSGRQPVAPQRVGGEEFKPGMTVEWLNPSGKTLSGKVNRIMEDGRVSIITPEGMTSLRSPLELRIIQAAAVTAAPPRPRVDIAPTALEPGQAYAVSKDIGGLYEGQRAVYAGREGNLHRFNVYEADGTPSGLLKTEASETELLKGLRVKEGT